MIAGAALLAIGSVGATVPQASQSSLAPDYPDYPFQVMQFWTDIDMAMAKVGHVTCEIPERERQYRRLQQRIRATVARIHERLPSFELGISLIEPSPTEPQCQRFAAYVHDAQRLLDGANERAATTPVETRQ